MTWHATCQRIHNENARRRFLPELESYLQRTGMAATNFGIAAVADGDFVHNLRNGWKGRAEENRPSEEVHSRSSRGLDLRVSRNYLLSESERIDGQSGEREAGD